MLDRYIGEGNPPDPPGRFLIWLSEREPVFGFRFAEEWLDIGDPQQLLEADNRYRVRAGLPSAEICTRRKRSVCSSRKANGLVTELKQTCDSFGRTVA